MKLFFFLLTENFLIFPENALFRLYFSFFNILCILGNSIIFSVYLWICNLSFQYFYFCFFFNMLSSFSLITKIFIGKKSITMWDDNLVKITIAKWNLVLSKGLETSQGQVWGVKEFLFIIITFTSFLGWIYKFGCFPS